MPSGGVILKLDAVAQAEAEEQSAGAGRGAECDESDRERHWRALGGRLASCSRVDSTRLASCCPVTAAILHVRVARASRAT